MNVECPYVVKIKLMKEVIENGIHETFIKYFSEYLREHELDWTVVDYSSEGYPELIGVVLDLEVQREDASETVKNIVDSIGLDFLVELYSPRLGFCYIQLIKPEWVLKYALSKDYESMSCLLEKYKEKFEKLRQFLDDEV